MSGGSDLTEIAVELCRQRGYEFAGDLGKGAFKSAYLVKSDEGFSALKLAIIAGAPDRLIRESFALQGCSHPSIARLLEAFPHQHGTQTFWVVREEFLSGGTLEQRLQGTVIAPDQVREIGVALAEVLGHLHERRLVHRDIKPANILFRDDGSVPVLTDFGVVRMLDQPSLTRDFAGLGPGTPAYAAPEQLNNEKAHIDWRTDQFGLAIVLSECLTGHHPFMEPGRSVHEAIMAVASKQPLKQAAQDELTGLGFACLVQALQPWPVSRFRKPTEFVGALNQT